MNTSNMIVEILKELDSGASGKELLDVLKMGKKCLYESLNELLDIGEIRMRPTYKTKIEALFFHSDKYFDLKSPYNEMEILESMQNIASDKFRLL